MKRLKSLNRYQKCVLLVTAVMMLVFTVLYFVTTSRLGVRYMDAHTDTQPKQWQHPLFWNHPRETGPLYGISRQDRGVSVR